MDKFNGYGCCSEARVFEKDLQELGSATIKKMERLAKKDKRSVFGMTLRLDDMGKWNVWTTHGPLPPKKTKVTVALGMGIQVSPRGK